MFCVLETGRTESKDGNKREERTYVSKIWLVPSLNLIGLSAVEKKLNWLEWKGRQTGAYLSLPTLGGGEPPVGSGASPSVLIIMQLSSLLIELKNQFKN